MSISNIEDLENLLKEFNSKHPRPHGAVEMTELLDISIMERAQWPSNDKPGVYIFLDSEKYINYIGKASSNIGSRLVARFNVTRWKPKVPEAEGCHYITTIPLPVDAFFEAPAIEEYLLRFLTTKSNRLHNG